MSFKPGDPIFVGQVSRSVAPVMDRSVEAKKRFEDGAVCGVDFHAQLERWLWVEWLIVSFNCYVIPVGRDKVPAVKWKQYQETPPPAALVREWFLNKFPEANASVLMHSSGWVGVDPDSADGLEFIEHMLVAHHAPAFAVRTRQGKHFYYPVNRDPNARVVHQRLGGHVPPRPPVVSPDGRVTEAARELDLLRIDIKAWGGYLVAPGSVHATGHVYTFSDALPTTLGGESQPSGAPFDVAHPNPLATPLPAAAFDELCFCGLSQPRDPATGKVIEGSKKVCHGKSPGLFTKAQVQNQRPIERDAGGSRMDLQAISDLGGDEHREARGKSRKMLRKLEGAGGGSRHKSLYYAACFMLIDVLLPEHEVLLFLEQLNGSFVPPVTDPLTKFLADAKKYSTHTPGSKLEKNNPRRFVGKATDDTFEFSPQSESLAVIPPRPTAPRPAAAPSSSNPTPVVGKTAPSQQPANPTTQPAIPPTPQRIPGSQELWKHLATATAPGLTAAGVEVPEKYTKRTYGPNPATYLPNGKDAYTPLTADDLDERGAPDDLPPWAEYDGGGPEEDAGCPDFDEGLSETSIFRSKAQREDLLMKKRPIWGKEAVLRQFAVMQGLSEKVTKRLGFVLDCGKLIEEGHCYKHGLDHRKGWACERTALCPYCASARAKILSRHIKDRWPRMAAPTFERLTMVSVQLPGSIGKKIRNPDEETYDLENAKEKLKALRLQPFEDKFFSGMKRSYRWVIGATRLLFFIGDSFAMTYTTMAISLRKKACQLGLIDPTKEIDEKYWTHSSIVVTGGLCTPEEAAKEFEAVWTEPSRLFHELLEQRDYENLAVFPWLHDDEAYRRTAGSVKSDRGGPTTLPWLSDDAIRAEASKESKAARFGIDFNHCSRVEAPLPGQAPSPCNAPLYFAIVDATDGERLATFAEGTTPWKRKRAAVQFCAAKHDHKAGCGRVAHAGELTKSVTPPP